MEQQHLEVSSNSPVILVVDDKRSTRLVISKVLQRIGYHVVEAESGQEAIEFFHKYNPTIILMDIVMPGINGLTTCEKIKRLPGGEKTQILMFTGTSEGALVEKSFKAGANDFITKPINWEELKYRVSRLVQVYNMHEQIQRQHYYDSLTGLPNRMVLKDRLLVAINQLAKTNGKLALLFFSIKNFHLINEAFGYEEGDLLLKEIAHRLEAFQDASFTITKAGLADFPCIANFIQTEEEVAKKADEIMTALSETWTIKGQEIYLDFNVGISLYPNDGNDSFTLLKNAEFAMGRASQLKPNSYCFYNEEMNSKALERISIENKLRNAASKGEFVIHYQPKVLSETGTISGVEALIRWQDSENKLIPPNEFIPIIEENGLIIEVGNWVLKNACEQVKKWIDLGYSLTLSVNFSLKQFHDEKFVLFIKQVCQETKFPMHLLTVEITESVAMKDIHHTIRCLEELRALNIKIAIDDFGTGYCSLSYLKQLPLNELKIDRSFIKDLLQKNEDGAIIDMILGLGKTLKLNVVAEGVETIDQLNHLKKRNCREMQGFLFSKPLPTNEFDKLLLLGTFIKDSEKKTPSNLQNWSFQMKHNQANILIIDDSRTNRIFLEKHLQRAGFHNIKHACDGEEGLEIIDSNPPDLIILDIIMPKLDGFEVCRRTKQNPQTKMIPIIMVTGLEDFEAKLKCLRYGADDLLNKPVNPPELLARVNTLVQVKQYFDELQRLNQQLMENYKTAERIQKALLPKTFPTVEKFEFDAYYQPTDFIGGDYYNVFRVDKENVCIYIADVMGHQFDGAMLTVFIKEFISGYSKRVVERCKLFSPAECLTELDQAFKKEDFPADLFITLFVATYHIPSETVTYSSAGFAQEPIVYGGAEIRKLHCDGKLIMALDCPDEFIELKTKLLKGEGILFYTDGVIEEMNNSNEEPFGVERLIDVISLLEEKDKKELIPFILKQLKLFSSKETFNDDVALVNFFRKKM